MKGNSLSFSGTDYVESAFLTPADWEPEEDSSSAQTPAICYRVLEQ